MKELTLIPTVLIFCSLLGFLWTYLLLTHKRGNSLANRLLAILMGFLSILIVRQVRFNEPFHGLNSFIYFLCNGLIFLIGPAIYFYIKTLIGSSFNKVELIRHFIPSIFISFIMIIAFLYKTQYSETNNTTILKFSLLTFIGLQVTHLFLYILFSWKLVKRFEKKITDYHSSMTLINLKWMKQLMVLASVLLVTIFSMYILIITGGYYEMNNSADTLFLIMVAIMILTIAIKSWKQPEIVSGIYEEQDKYKTSPLTEVESKKIKEKLGVLIETEKIYLTPQLSLNELAQKLNVKSYIVSQFINQVHEQNFFNFINDLRIEFAISRIQSGYLKKNTLIGLAFESGFNSPSTFNRAFKKKMGSSAKNYYKFISNR